jgi:Tol biopolymer transport system component
VRPKLKLLASAGVGLLVIVGLFAVTRGGSEETDGDQLDRRGPAAPAEQPDLPPFVLARGSDIYVIEVATRSVDRITSHDGETASDPSWSAGEGIIFSKISSPGTRPRLVVVKPDGSKGRTVPRRISHLMQPTWAPGGRRIAAVRLGLGVHIGDLRTGSVRRLTAASPASGAPAWSPDGRTIVFQEPAPGAPTLELHQGGAFGGSKRRLTRDHLQQSDPAWAPDGSRLVFAEQRGNGNWVIVTMKLDGSGRKQLTDERYTSQEPSWSPDGKRIAFALQAAGRGSVAIIDPTGGAPVRITPRSLVVTTHPVWSPDGKKIAFVGRRGQQPPPSPAPGAPVIPQR